MAITSYKNLSIKDGQRIHEARAKTYELEIERNIAVLNIITGKPVSYYESMPIGKVLEIYNKKTKWIDTIPDVKYIKPLFKFPYYYKFKTNPNQLSKDEMILLMEFNKDEQEKNLHRSAALYATRYSIFTFRPVKVKDVVKEFERKSELFHNKLSYAIAYAFSVFFLKSLQSFSTIGLASSLGRYQAARDFLQNNPR